MTAPSDEFFMARAVRLARRGLYSTDPNPRVGCVLVKAGEIVGEGWTEPAGGPHAERMALDRAGGNAGFDPMGAGPTKNPIRQDHAANFTQDRRERLF